jgi:hypothetical protein
MTTLKVFEVDVGGATYWVAANAPEECAAVIKAADGFDCAEECSDPPAITELTTEQVRAKHVRDEEGGRTPMIDFLMVAFEPEVIACTEWP